ncbi:hypothetical protein [Streptomyces sp. NPDC056291]|uniref:hypothetical protein n=1 Tax=Streptomyces sp. NPDC056291 TaxID=3345772 RepID=UPI0035D9F39A
MTRQIDTKTPNPAATQPATVKACQQDLGTAAERAGRAEEAVGLSETAKFHAKASAEAARGRR